MEKKAVLLHLVCGVLAVFSVAVVKAEDPYKFYTWTVTYGTRSPLGVPQQVVVFAISAMSVLFLEILDFSDKMCLLVF